MTSPHDQIWDPVQYSRFTDLRLRPGLDLLSRIAIAHPGAVIDLGCGTGALTAALRHRWPEARIIGVDASTAMLKVAQETDPGVEWELADISHWTPTEQCEVIYSNAALHWVPNHQRLFPDLLRTLSPGGCLAVQMPDNWEQPTHTIPATILEESRWPEAARAAFLRNPVARPAAYRRWLKGATSIDVWHTTYQQVLSGENPVLAWVKGSVLAPVLSALADDQRQEFETRVAADYATAYPPEPDGTTVLPFTRLFLLAVK